jgi:adenylate kinase
MRIIIFGSPGSGKGTQAELICKKLNIPHISTGDILRAEIRNKTKLGCEVEKYIVKGELGPDKLIVDILRLRIKEKDCVNGFLLDGFPRTVSQAKILNEFRIKIDVIIELKTNDSDVIKRLSGRRVHVNSGRVYHVLYNPSKIEGKDDMTGEPLIHRDDDKEDTIKNRLSIYYKELSDLMMYYKDDIHKSQIKYYDIDGTGSIEEVHKHISQKLKIVE